MSDQLFYKYDVPVPRYTSYPTVPYWSDSPTTPEWIESLKRAYQSHPLWSLYVHIPYCETLCTFCGCNTSITKNHKREEPYMEMLMSEYKTYLEKVPALKDSPMQQFHFGGGTPTFLSPKNLQKL
ncbi:MAG: coproporphyrinogen III oxidase, partial [Pseudomonadota bacterium]